jgi:hypothetical protein
VYELQPLATLGTSRSLNHFYVHDTKLLCGDQMSERVYVDVVRVCLLSPNPSTRGRIHSLSTRVDRFFPNDGSIVRGRTCRNTQRLFVRNSCCSGLVDPVHFENFVESEPSIIEIPPS